MEIPKRPDFTGGDHSAKNWFKIMWQNSYIQLFAVFLTMFVFQILNLDWCAEVWLDCYTDGWIGTIAASIGMLIPISGSIIIGYKGFYQFWEDLKKGN